MNRQSSWVVWVLVSVVAMSCSNGWAGMLLEEGFETGFSDDTVINGINGWTSDTGVYAESNAVPSHGTFAVRTDSDTVSANGAKTFSAVGGGESDFYARQFVHFNGLNEVGKSDMARFWISDNIGGLFGTGSAYLAATYNRYQADKWYVDLAYWYKNATGASELSSSKRFWYDPGLNDGVQGINASIGSSNSVWYEIQITYDTAAKTVSWDIREEGGTWLNIAGLAIAGTTWTPARININSGNFSIPAVQACLDDVMVRQGPVPPAGTVVSIN